MCIAGISLSVLYGCVLVGVPVSPEGPFFKLGDVVVAEVNLDKDLEVVESTLMDRL